MNIKSIFNMGRGRGVVLPSQPTVAIDPLAADALEAANRPKISEEAARELYGTEEGAAERERQRLERIREQAKRIYSGYQMNPGIPPVVDACQVKARGKDSGAFEEAEVKFRQLLIPEKRGVDFIATVTNRQADKDFKAQGPNFRALLVAGEAEKVARQDAWEKHDLQADYAIKRKAAKQEVRKIRAEAVLIAFPLVKLIEAAAREIHDEMLAKEKAEAEKYGVPFWPSPACVAFGRQSWQVSDQIAGMVYGTTVKDTAALVGIKI